MRRVLIICYDNYQNQPRVLRTIKALNGSYHLTVAGYSSASEHIVEFIDLSINASKRKRMDWHFNKPFFIKWPVSFYYKFIKQKQFYKPWYFEQIYWDNVRTSDLETLKGSGCDLIICHGVDSLPLAVRLSGGRVPVIFNAHEYYPLEFENDPDWINSEGKKIQYFINKYLPKCTHMFCVSSEICKKYQERSKVNATVITNATEFEELEPRPVSDIIKIIHHGAAIRAREIEIMADLIPLLEDRFELNLMLVPTDKVYHSELRTKYQDNSRINFLDPVPTRDIAKECNKYDIGLFILPPVNYNWLNALPNKLFEFVQARLCIAVSPNPDMKRTVEENDLGIVSDDYTAIGMAKKLNLLNKKEIEKYKMNSHHAADRLSGDRNCKLMKDAVDNILDKCAA